MGTLIRIMLLSMLTATIVFGQQVHSLVPDIRNNRVELTVANRASLLTGNVEVRAVRHPPYVTFSSTIQILDSIGPGKEQAVVFFFDVARSAPVNKLDTLEFCITEKNGAIWMKSIVVQYAGPTVFALDQNYPNPFNPATTIKYQLPIDSRVSLKVYDVLGREVATLVNEDQPAGYYDTKWNATGAASGVYFYRVEARPTGGGQSFEQIKKLMVLK